MDMLLLQTVEFLILPPGGPLVLLFLAILLGLVRLRKTAWFFILIATISLYFTSIPWTTQRLTVWLENHPPVNTALAAEMASKGEGPKAIVVLGFERYMNAPEYGGSTSAGSEFERLRYAAWLHRKTGLPLIVIGGDRYQTGTTQATLMRNALLNELGSQVLVADGRSRHTLDNARFAREMLDRHSIDSVYLVTHAWHMHRAARAFRRAGMTVVPAPTAFTTANQFENGWRLWIPTDRALQNNNRMFHEIGSLIWFNTVAESLM